MAFTNGADQFAYVAIPRRVRRRFPHQHPRRDGPFRMCVAIPRRVRRRFPRHEDFGTTSFDQMSQSPAGSAADFHGGNPQPQPLTLIVSQSPAGSAADFHFSPLAVAAVAAPRVAIPRRVRRRFPREIMPISAREMFCVAIPRRVRRRFPRQWVLRRRTTIFLMSQSPAGSAADFHHLGFVPTALATFVSQSPAGSAADFHAATDSPGTESEGCRNPPQGPPPISTSPSP